MSPSMGILWYQPSQVQWGKPLNSLLRHEANRDDQLKRFGWNQHDGGSFGKQEIIDPYNHVNLTVQWVSIETQDAEETGRWVLRVTGEYYSSIDTPHGSTDLSLLWYVATAGNWTATYDARTGIIHGENFESCIRPSVNTLRPSYSNDNAKKFYNETYFAVFQVPTDQHFNPKPTILQELRNPTSALPPHLFDPTALYRAETIMTGNQIVLQLFLSTPFEVDFHFTLQDASRPSTQHSTCGPSWDKVSDALDTAQTNLQQRFTETFVERRNRTHSMEYLPEHEVISKHTSLASWTPEQMKTAQYALGNMMSSISYMHGRSQLYDFETKQVAMGPLTEGLTIVPDRPDHAQGYLWDDGFHQHLVRYWDVDWTLGILRSWYDKVDEAGWIPRQMIIGDEARWSARPTSWPQIPGSANPPSHHLVLVAMLDQNGDQNDLRDFFSNIWKPLQRNFMWYLTTQASVLPGFFRWRGRTEEYCLPSGMDDYPRAPILTENEAHLDLHCWMISSSISVSKVASFLGQAEIASHYQQMADNLTESLLKNFWNDDAWVFDDFYYTEDGKKAFVGHLGYLNFFPLFLDAIPTNTSQFETTMERLLDRENGLWSNYGLRSLSAKDPYFMKGDAYWTGLIWLNINYFAASTFHKYSNNPEDYPMPPSLRNRIQDAYQELRNNLISLVVSEFMETGFIWEVYDGTTGTGHDNHPFTGWSALIVNIMAELF